VLVEANKKICRRQDRALRGGGSSPKKAAGNKSTGSKKPLTRGITLATKKAAAKKAVAKKAAPAKKAVAKKAAPAKKAVAKKAPAKKAVAKKAAPKK